MTWRLEKIYIEFKHGGDALKSVKCGLDVLGSDNSEQRCENFLERFYEEIRRDDALYRAVNMILQESGIKISKEEFRKLNEEIDNLTEIVGSKEDNKTDICHRETARSRTGEYAGKWEANMFLNNFGKRDEKAGVNVRLCEVYLEFHLPHYLWKKNPEPMTDLKELLSEYIYNNKERKMLVILGQPGIGKSADS